MNIEYSLGKPSGELPVGRFNSTYGPVLISWCSKRLCYLGFTDSKRDIHERWPKVNLVEHPAPAGLIDNLRKGAWQSIPLRLIGTEFQHQVWRALLSIPAGETVSYSQIASQIRRPSAQRAVASAIGQNPISWVIPCHRVILSSGDKGNYHWGPALKNQLLIDEKTQ